MREYRGEDSHGYKLENGEFSVVIDISIYNESECEVHSFQHETGTIIMDGKAVKFNKTDLNKPAANAAVNADGSRSKPVEKNLEIDVHIPEENAIISVNYSKESSTVFG